MVINGARKESRLASALARDTPPSTTQSASALGVVYRNLRLAELDESIVTTCLRELRLCDIPKIRRSSRRVYRISIESYLPAVFEGSYNDAMRHKILVCKFAACRVVWPVRILPILLQHRDLIDYQGPSADTLLSVASDNGRADIVNVLLKAMADPNLPNNAAKSPLWLASRDGRNKIVKALVLCRHTPPHSRLPH